MDNQTAVRLKKRLAEEFREQLTMGAPTDADEAGLRRLAAQLRARKVLEFVAMIGGIENELDRRWYGSVLLNRLMLIYFLQKKGFLDGGDRFYLRNKLEVSRSTGEDLYFDRFLRPLFFEGFGKPESERSAEARLVLGEICYLDGGLFIPHRIELENPAICVPDKAFEDLLRLFERYSWNLDGSPGGQDDEINPDVLGYHGGGHGDREAPPLSRSCLLRDGGR